MVRVVKSTNSYEFTSYDCSGEQSLSFLIEFINLKYTAMKLFLDNHFFLSVIENDNKYSCQVMELVHGYGMNNATVTESDQDDIVSCIVYENHKFNETFKNCNTLTEVGEFHLQLLIEVWKAHKVFRV